MSSVDVIVPCYRYGHFLKQCVESVLQQSGPAVRVVIIDDASPDNTFEVGSALARHDARVTVIRHTVNRGNIRTYNEGIDWVKAKYFLLLSADDYLLPGALARAVELLEKYPELGFAFGNVVETGHAHMAYQTNLMECKNEKKVMTGPEFIAMSGARTIVSTPTAVVRTELQKKVGGYRPELPHAGDMEMWFRLAAHGSVGFIKSPQAVYRHHANNMSLSYMGKLADLEQRRAVLDIFFHDCGYLLSNSRYLHRRMFDLLARDAVGLASSAFNDGKMELSAELANFATRITPRVTKSFPWAKLRCKRFIGPRAWNALQPLTTRFRLARRGERPWNPIQWSTLPRASGEQQAPE